MTKEKFKSLSQYAMSLRQRLDSPTPEKHLGRPQEYKEFLNRELKAVERTLEEARYEAAEGKLAK